MKRPNYSHFSNAPQVLLPRSAFDMSFTYKTAFDAGGIYPVASPIEILPGDTLNLSLQAFMRLSTPIVPFMDNLYCQIFVFFVPNRLVLTHWPEVNGAREDPYDPDTDVPYEVPRLWAKANSSDTTGVDFGVGSLADYFGLPPNVKKVGVNVLPFRGYNLIWNEWFRAGDIIQSLTVNLDDNDEYWGSSIYAVRSRAKRPDYFNRCLPFPQRGPGVELPLGTSAPVIGNGTSLGLTNGTDEFGLHITSGGLVGQNAAAFGIDVGDSFTPETPPSESYKGVGVSTDPDDSGLAADLSHATAATINSLRQAFQIQRLYERDARSGGNRYIEVLRAHFGVISPDARLQRPEYLGGGIIPIQIHSVAQTSETNDTPQGNLAGIGLAGGNIKVSHSFVEHGFVFILANVYQDYTYQQGIDRMWSRRSRFDYYWPTLAHLGEQAVLSKEIYADGSSDDDLVFGYQERYAEYRYGISKITGKLRSGVTGSLDVWHLAQYFQNRPVLGATFISEAPPLGRVLAVSTEPQFIYDSVVKCTMVRPMPAYSIPGLADHF